ncbi:chaperone NapD [Candidatus Vondammii sp. HM_W22]|uniref:chaperone NapD n=1 Tax=Candidatus Vondammii sp. HM_W22 TaxID=2687299 RepID=UPI001F129299|nr:chaperone NapD [Candidatus Vondammii sp. HM_W22]
MNMCSVIVNAKPENCSVVQTRLEELPGVEVHGGGGEGKLIVTVEDGEDITAGDTMLSLNSIEGVISSTLIYHYGGDDLDEEVIGETN